MYTAYYKLKDDPFRLTPDKSFLYMTVQHREALSGLVHAVCNHSGLTVLAGEAGTGKTTLLYILRDWLDKRRFVTAFCTNPILTREELFDFLLADLGIECPSALKNRQLTALQQGLERYRSQNRRAVLIVDEAQRMPAQLLEEIRLLLNLETPREKLLQIMLVGQPELTDMLRRPELRQLKQRVSCYCRLEPLSVYEVSEYVHHRLAQAGLPQQTLFSAETLELVSLYTRGIPRLVNTLCDNALQTAFALESPHVTCSIIDEAAHDLDLITDETHTPIKPELIPGATSPTEAEMTIGAQVGRPSNDRDLLMNGSRTPLESYASRQKSLGFLGSLMERWK